MRLVKTSALLVMVALLGATLVFASTALATHLTDPRITTPSEEDLAKHRSAPPPAQPSSPEPTVDRSNRLVTNPLTGLEMYAGLFGGVTFPQPLNDITGSVGPLSGGISDVSLKSSFIYGVKLGIFNPRVPWIGFELEVFTTTPHTKQQSVDVNLNGTIIGSATTIGAHNRVTTLALNPILRYTGKQVHPYVGVGPAVFFAHSSNILGSDSNTAWGLNALAGARVFFTQQLAFFTEYKFNHVTFSFEGPSTVGSIRGKEDYDAHHIVAGLSFSF